MNNAHAKTVIVCPNLAGDNDVVCKAFGKEVYYPSVFQQEEFCATSNSRSCPFYSLPQNDPKGVIP